jgi:hypothetical protein
LSGCIIDVDIEAEAAYELYSATTVRLGELPVPVLALFAGVDRVPKTRSQLTHGVVAQHPKVRDRQLFFRQLDEKEESDRGAGGLSVIL